MAEGAKRPRSVRSIRRLDEIRQAATREIIEHGFDNLSVSHIASAAGVSVGGVYRYISTKTDLLVLVCKGIYDGVREQLGEIAAGEGSFHQRLEAALDCYFRECRSKRGHIAMVYREYRRLPKDAQPLFMQREQAIADVFADLIRAGAKSGAFRPVDATVLSFDIIFLGHMPAFKNWAFRDVVSPEELHREQIALIMSRVAPTPAQGVGGTGKDHSRDRTRPGKDENE